MIKRLIKLLFLILILSFFIIVINYYLSEKNISLINENRTNIESKTLDKVSNLIVLPNNTNNVIEFNSDLNNSNKQNYKRSFWELFK
mgnify:CR=1 FL=1